MSVLYALVIVTQAGMVSFTPGFPTEALCLDALSVAKTGYTVAEQTAQRAQQERQLEEDAAKWRATHPPRLPKDDRERAVVGDFKKDGHWSCTFLEDNRPCLEPTREGLVIEHRIMRSYRWQTTSDNIKFARCLIEPTP